MTRKSKSKPPCDLKTSIWNTKRIVIMMTGFLTVVAGLAAFSKNLSDISENFAKLLNGDRPKLEAVVKDLESESAETRIVALSRFETVAINNKTEADNIVRILESYINRRAKANPTSPARPQSQEIVKALASLGHALKRSNDKSFAIRPPEFHALDFSTLDLSGIYLRGSTFTDINFDEAVMEHSDLSGSLLIDVKFSRVQAHNATFSSARIKNSCAEESIFDNSDLSGIEVTSSDFNGASFKNATLLGAKFDNSRLSFALLDGANLNQADLQSGLELIERQLASVKFRKDIKLPVPLYRKSKLTVCRKA